MISKIRHVGFGTVFSGRHRSEDGGSHVPCFLAYADLCVLVRPCHAALKMMRAPAAHSLTEAPAPSNPASVAGLDPVSPKEIGTSATVFLKDAKKTELAEKRKQSAPGRKQDRTSVAGGQDYAVGYEARKSNASRASVKKAVKKVGKSRKGERGALAAEQRTVTRP